MESTRAYYYPSWPPARVPGLLPGVPASTAKWAIRFVSIVLCVFTTLAI